MKRTPLFLLLGLAVGVATHMISYQVQHPSSFDSLDGQLAWMKTELHLDAAQFARIRELHQTSSPRLRALAAQVEQLQAEFAAFEHTRRTTDRVDFLGFARFAESRRAINRECLASTRQLVRAAAEVMTPDQRAHYLGLVSAAESAGDKLLN